MVACALVVCSGLAADTVILDNGALHIEVDPGLFAVRFVGRPGGANLVEPLYVSAFERAGREWLDTGGLVTDLVPCEERDGALRRGPAEVLRQDERSVLLLGPESPRLRIRLKKEICLVGEEPRARVEVTALSSSPDPYRFALRNTAWIPQEATVRLACIEGPPRPLVGLTALPPAAREDSQGWRIEIPPAERLRRAMLGAFAREVVLESAAGTWVRRIVNMPEASSSVPGRCTFLCFLDDETRSYAVALQGAEKDVDAGSPLVLIEDWELKAPAEAPERIP